MTRDPSGRQPGRSRLDTRRREKIAAMVDGYRSNHTIALALRNLFTLWCAPTFALAALGMVALVRHRELGPDDLVIRLLGAFGVGVGVLGLLTLLVAIVYGVFAWTNAACVGRRVKIPYWRTSKPYLAAAVVGGIILGGSVVAPIASPWPRVVGAALIGLALLVVWAWLYEVLRMLWRSGAAPLSGDNELPPQARYWIFGLLVFSGGLGLSEVITMNVAVYAAHAIAVGLAGFAAAVVAGRLVVDISRRQDERLSIILSQLDGAEDGIRGPVTNKQLESAWQSSETLVSFDY